MKLVRALSTWVLISYISYTSYLVSGLTIASDLFTIEYTPGKIAIEDFYAGEGTFVDGGIYALIHDDDVDLGTNSEMPSLRTYHENRNLRIIYTMTETYYRIVANKKSGIEKLEDLKGKVIGSIPTTTAAYFAEKYLATVGLAPEDFEFKAGQLCSMQPCGNTSLPAMMMDGTIDAIALWEPTPQMAIDMLGDDAIVFQDRSVYREIVNLQSTVEKLADPDTRKDIVNFVKAVHQAQQVFNDDPESLYERVADMMGSDSAVIESVWGIHGWRGELAPDIVDVLQEEEAYAAKIQDREPLDPDVIADLVDWSIMEEAFGS